MMQYKSLSWDLSSVIGCKSYSEMFGTEDPKRVYRQLLKKWHPDHSKYATEDAFIHINAMFSKGNSVSSNLTNINGININVTYSILNSLYEMYFDATKSSMYLKFLKASDKLSKNFISNKKTVDAFLETFPHKDRYSDISNLKLLEKDGLYKLNIPSSYVPLNLLIEYIHDFRDFKISAYVISRLWDHAMLYSTAGLNYIGCDPSFIFVDTKTHKIIDCSSLFFSTKKCNMIALSSYQASSVIKSDISNKTISTPSINSLIINLGYHLAGDTNKTGNINLLDKDEACFEMIKSLNSFSINSSTLSLYKKWQTEEVASIFKERSFYKKEILFNDLISYIK